MKKPLLIIMFLAVCGCGSENETSPNNTTNKVLPMASIVIDGASADWSSIAPQIIDPANDANGNGATDLIEFSAAKSNTKIALMIKTKDNIAMPHTPGQTYSHYEVGVHMYTDDFCNNKIAGSEYFIVNNFTNSTDVNYHRIEDYSGLVGSQSTDVAYATNILETSFDASIFPSSMKSFQFNIYSQSFGPAGNIKHDEMSMSGCYKLP